VWGGLWWCSGSQTEVRFGITGEEGLFPACGLRPERGKGGER